MPDLRVTSVKRRGEPAVGDEIVAVEAPRHCGIPFAQRATLDEEEVEVAVAVVVEERGASAHLLGNVVLPAGSADMGEPKAGLSGNLEKQWRWRRRLSRTEDHAPGE